MSVIVLGSDIVHYEVLGRGRPLLFLHGWVGSWRYWIPSMQAASISYRTYALDLWGFGDTTKSKRYLLAEQAELLNGFMDSMGILRIALIGHGLGALVAIQFAMQHPELVDRVMAISCPLDDGMISSRLKTATPVDIASSLLTKSAITDPVLMETPKADQLAIQNSIKDYAGSRLPELLKSFPTSCLFVHGQNDPIISLPRADQLAEFPLQTHAITFEQSGHFPMLDESAKFNRLVIDFLSLASGESPRDLQLKDEWKRRVR
ncbi:MAG TPA: alpha/beta hydrolase [Anaerolineaceae bacterium]|nr:alpha/beta hydrolase [Chloroflexota bacterium]HOU42726.1 alpha/beta hydrolase [Anaerolineaceae bacterium]HPA32135.1 alpha/beta hydrolase [Anaerolineaceae bacterium]HQF45244.1 alpha/beta hydrolase [Anaerolineaceae bacterium]HQJ02405.1 alpha/beta hydrolase [Anaerolineaceae bacterium]